METMTITIDGVDFEVPKAAGQATLKLVARNDEHVDQLAKQSKEIAVEKARADKAEEDRDAAIKERSDAASPEAIDAAVKSRVELVTQAKSVLGEKDDKGKAWNFDGASDEEIREAVIIKVSPAAEEKIDALEGEARVAYVAARYDAAIESGDKADAAPKGNQGLRRFRIQSDIGGGDRTDAVETARQKGIEANRLRGIQPLGTPVPARASLIKD